MYVFRTVSEIFSIKSWCDFEIGRGSIDHIRLRSTIGLLLISVLYYIRVTRVFEIIL